MPTLSEISNKIKSLAVAYAPKKTGNLRKQLDTYNRPSGMIKVDNKTKSFTFELDVAPPGAEYGQYWNDPNVSWQVKQGGNPKNINFADKAINSPEVNKMIDDYVNSVVDDVVKQLGDSIQNEFKDFK